MSARLKPLTTRQILGILIADMIEAQQHGDQSTELHEAVNALRVFLRELAPTDEYDRMEGLL